MRTRIVAAALIVASMATSQAHDAQNRSNWIGEGQYRSRQGQMCCGPNDCAMLDSEAVTFSSKGYVIKGWGDLF